jgi:hypothetical protein
MAALPVLASVQRGAWTAALTAAGLWALIVVVVAIPIRGRSATGWLLAVSAFLLGRQAGWSRWRSRAATGAAENLGEADLPGVLQAVQVHDGPPHGPGQVRVAVVQNHALGTWAVTAQVTHPGIGLLEAHVKEHCTETHQPWPAQGRCTRSMNEASRAERRDRWAWSVCVASSQGGPGPVDGCRGGARRLLRRLAGGWLSLFPGSVAACRRWCAPRLRGRPACR